MKLDDKDKDLLLSNSLHIYFKHFKGAFIFGKEHIITLEEVESFIRIQELTKMKQLKGINSCEGLSVSKGMGENKGNQNGNKSMSKSNSNSFDKSKLKCFSFPKIGYFGKDYPEREHA